MARNNPLFPKKIPRSFPLHRDLRSYSQDPHGLEADIKALMNVPQAAAALEPNPVPDWPVKRFFRKHRARTNDPICVLAVIEALLYMSRGTYARVDYLMERIEREWPHYHWDNYIVGRMLAALQTACEEDYGNQFGRLDAPIGRGRDGRSSYYVVDPHGGNEGLGWLLNARKRAMQMSFLLMQMERRGEFGQWFIENKSSNQPSDLYTQWFSGCNCRTPEFYKAQWTNEAFYPTAKASDFDRHDPFA